jgi:hypothetical protein
MLSAHPGAAKVGHSHPGSPTLLVIRGSFGAMTALLLSRKCASHLHSFHIFIGSSKE